MRIKVNTFLFGQDVVLLRHFLLEEEEIRLAKPE